VLETCKALFISVEYRRAPDYPFPTATDDAADALLYLIRNAEELGVDPMKLATSGFSAGGNLALTAPLRLRSYLDSLSPSDLPVPQHCLVAVVTWYPLTDCTVTRAEKRERSVRPELTLSTMITDFIDGSYLHPPDLDMSDPCLSPLAASDDILRAGIPHHVLFYTCEWDMLLREGEELAHRLGRDPIGKDVRYKMIESVQHGWDKSTDPWTPAIRSEELYLESCLLLKEIFESAC
jgi:acetyl esterase/lipase